MIYKTSIMLLVCLFSLNPLFSAESNAQVEIFDIEKGKIIKTVPPSRLTELEAKNFINNIKSIYVKVTPIPKKGVIIKIPLQSSIHVKNKWVTTDIDQLFIIFPKDEKPFIMFFDRENRLHFFNINGNTDALLKYLDYTLN